MLVIEPGFKGSVDRAALRYFAEWMRLEKKYLKHIQRIYPRSEYCQKMKEARVVEARIKVLSGCIRQIHVLRELKGRKS